MGLRAAGIGSLLNTWKFAFRIKFKSDLFANQRRAGCQQNHPRPATTPTAASARVSRGHAVPGIMNE